MVLAPIEGKPVRFPPGKIAVRLTQEHWRAYRELYASYQSILAGLPVLRERDFDGRRVLMSPQQLESLNGALASLDGPPGGKPGSAFGSQEASRSGLFKRLQYLS